MHYYEVAPTKIIRSGTNTLTYCSSLELSIGQIVDIEVGKKYLIGVVVQETAKPAYETKPIKSIIGQKPLPIELVKLAGWMASYYSSPLALVYQTMLPRGIKIKRKARKITPNYTKRNRTKKLFNADQSAAIEAISQLGVGTYLLQGVTGSGKTEVYIELAKSTILAGKSVIILVPEIALTSQLVAEFSNHFENILVTHSGLTESERHTMWLEAINSNAPRVVIGPRSAIFTPLTGIGLIVLDEAHEPSYKQEQSPKYSALRVATMLGRYHDARVVFGSATPNITDRYVAERMSRPILRLLHPARNNSLPPITSLVDMKNRDNFKSHRFLSNQLIEQIDSTIKSGKQVLIFHNRRGSASSTLCKECGWTSECPHCFLPMTLHVDKNKLICHICGHQENVPTSCPVCGSAEIVFRGFGTKLIESELKKLFPSANIARFDADNKKDEALNNRYKDLYSGAIDIAIGTQVVAKGLDLPNLRTVGVIQADTGLAIPDFNADERAFQLLAQVIGRVGRNEHQTNVIVQTYQPNHPSIAYGLSQDYESFYKDSLNKRRQGLFPPFTHLLKLTCTYKTEAAAIRNAKLLQKNLLQNINKSVRMVGPVPAFYERQNGTYRWQIVLKSPKREYLIAAMQSVPQNNWQTELDPTSLL